jgi:hypothetical protein
VVTDGYLFFGFSSNPNPITFSEIESSQAATMARVDYQRTGTANQLHVAYVNGGTAYFGTVDEEGTITMALTIGAGTQTAICWTQNGVLYTFRLNSGTIYGRAYSTALTAQEAEWTTNLTGVDNKPIAARASVDQDGKARIGIQYTIGSVLTFASSSDGKTFA